MPRWSSRPSNFQVTHFFSVSSGAVFRLRPFKKFLSVVVQSVDRVRTDDIHMEAMEGEEGVVSDEVEIEAQDHQQKSTKQICLDDVKFHVCHSGQRHFAEF